MDRLPEFLLGDEVIVDIADVIEQLGLTSLFNKEDGELQTGGRLAVPKRFLVVESENP